MLNREGDMEEGIEEGEDVGQRGGTWEGTRGEGGRQGEYGEREIWEESVGRRVCVCVGGGDCERNAEHG